MLEQGNPAVFTQGVIIRPLDLDFLPPIVSNTASLLFSISYLF